VLHVDDGPTARAPDLQQALDILLRAGIVPLTQSRIVHSYLYVDDQQYRILFDFHKPDDTIAGDRRGSGA
jgi:hypothetical protein